MWARRNGLPESVLELLTPTSHPWALDWRRRCYRLLALKGRRLGDGDLIRFPAIMRLATAANIASFDFGGEGRRPS